MIRSSSLIAALLALTCACRAAFASLMPSEWYLETAVNNNNDGAGAAFIVPASPVYLASYFLSANTFLGPPVGTLSVDFQFPLIANHTYAFGYLHQVSIVSAAPATAHALGNGTVSIDITAIPEPASASLL